MILRKNNEYKVRLLISRDAHSNADTAKKPRSNRK